MLNVDIRILCYCVIQFSGSVGRLFCMGSFPWAVSLSPTCPPRITPAFLCMGQGLFVGKLLAERVQCCSKNCRCPGSELFSQALHMQLSGGMVLFVAPFCVPHGAPLSLFLSLPHPFLAGRLPRFH